MHEWTLHLTTANSFSTCSKFAQHMAILLIKLSPPQRGNTTSIIWYMARYIWCTCLLISLCLDDSNRTRSINSSIPYIDVLSSAPPTVCFVCCMIWALPYALQLACEDMAQLGKLIERLPLPIVPPNLKIGHEIGSGAWGVVHEGELDGKPVAVKKIHRVLMDADHGGSVVRRFFEECERLKTIKHLHVISEQQKRRLSCTDIFFRRLVRQAT